MWEESRQAGGPKRFRRNGGETKEVRKTPCSRLQSPAPGYVLQTQGPGGLGIGRLERSGVGRDRVCSEGA